MSDVSSLTLTVSERRLLKRLSKNLPVDSRSLAELCKLGLAVEVFEDVPNANGYPIFSHIAISNSGLRYLQYRKEVAFDRWWTRGLAIAAIIISLIALLLEFQSRGWLFS